MEIKAIPTIVYAGRIKDHGILMKSSSGGAFTAISDVFLKKGDAVVCTIYNYESHMAEFCLITDSIQRDKARGSKYMQSRPGNIYKKAVQWLKENPQKDLLFIGMGCQSDGFRRYVEQMGIRDRVYLVDIICHGSPSPKIWREYIWSLEKKQQGRISALTFKDKRNGWRRPTAVLQIDGREISLKNYVKIFYNRCAMRPSCHRCPYAVIERKTDLTIGDFWHIEDTIPDFYHPDGNSLFLVHTNRGAELFGMITDAVEYRLSNITECWQKNLEKPTPMSEQRAKFWLDYEKKGIDYIIKKYGKTTFRAKIKNKIKHLLDFKRRI